MFDMIKCSTFLVDKVQKPPGAPIELVRLLASHDSPTMIRDVEKLVESMTIAQLFFVYSEMRLRDPKPITRKSIYIYGNAAKKMHEALPFATVGDLRHRRTWDYYRANSDDSPCTTNKSAYILCTFLGYMRRRGLLAWKPDTGYALFEERKPVQYPTQRELGLMCDGIRKATPTSPKDPQGRFRWRCRRRAIALGCFFAQYFCGFRVSAVVALKWKHLFKVSEGLYALRFAVPKTRRLHCIPLHPVLVRSIAGMSSSNLGYNYLQPVSVAMDAPRDKIRFGERPLFPGLSYSFIKSTYTKACKAKGIRRIKTHDIRRASATAWGCVDVRCGRIILGGYDERYEIPYFSEEQYLMKFMSRLPVPIEFYPPAERKKKLITPTEWSALFHSLPEHNRRILALMAEDMLGLNDKYESEDATEPTTLEAYEPAFRKLLAAPVLPSSQDGSGIG